MKHFVLTYPRLSTVDWQLIQDHRKQHDYLYNLIDPHFTLVFGTEMPSDQFVTEVRQQSLGLQQVRFSIRCAVVNKDAFSDAYFVFLVPDEGFSGFINMHDKLYAGNLFEFQRLDIDYIPHIEIAKSHDKMVCKKLADQWNGAGHVISGHVDLLEVITFKGGDLRVLERIPLK